MAREWRRRLGILVRAHTVTTATAIVLALAASSATALETDQFYSWAQPLRDSSAPINAKFETEINAALQKLKANATCADVESQVQRRFRRFIFHVPETWAANDALVDRVPASSEQRRVYQQRSIYAGLSRIATATWMPASPTVELGGVRLGTDKIGHFVSEGWLYYRQFKRGLHRGMTEAQAEHRAIALGMLLERTTLGYLASGIFSTADMEANYNGMLFYRSLCGGEAPLIERRAGRWTMVRRFDLRQFVTPEWDESYQPNAYRAVLWRTIRPAMAEHCAELHDPMVVARRAEYARRNTDTPSEKVLAELVAEHKLDDPARFSIETVCAQLAGSKP
jgi:hypothetical protein